MDGSYTQDYEKDINFFGILKRRIINELFREYLKSDLIFIMSMDSFVLIPKSSFRIDSSIFYMVFLFILYLMLYTGKVM